MLQSLDDDEKIKFTTPAHNVSGVLQSNTEYWFLTENGLYEVLMLSRKPKAKEFKKKVKEILKTIRKTGGEKTYLCTKNSCTHQSFEVFLYYQDPKEEPT